MMYQCIKCHRTWGEGEPELDGYSHGLCLKCLRDALIPLYRKRQSREGNFDCFGKAEGFCDQEACKYRRICLGEDTSGEVREMTPPPEAQNYTRSQAETIQSQAHGDFV